jgi:hypothetical protein
MEWAQLLLEFPTRISELKAQANELLLEKEAREEELGRLSEENVSLKSAQERLKQREEILIILKEESEKEIGMYICILSPYVICTLLSSIRSDEGGEQANATDAARAEAEDGGGDAGGRGQGRRGGQVGGR